MNYVYHSIHKGDPEGWNRKLRDTYEDVNKRFYATIIPFNYIALVVMDDALDTIDERGLLKHQVKKIARNIDRQRGVFRSSLRDSMSARKDGLSKNRMFLIQNMSLELYKILEHDLFLMQMSIKQVIDKAKLPDSSFKATIVMANTMLNFACQLFDEYFKAYKERTMADFHFDFVLGRLTGIQQDFIRISKIICPDIASIDFDSDNNCQTAFSVINHKIADGDALNTAGELAMKEDEVFKTYLDDQEREDVEKTLKEKYKVYKSKNS